MSILRCTGAIFLFPSEQFRNSWAELSAVPWSSHSKTVMPLQITYSAFPMEFQDLSKSGVSSSNRSRCAVSAIASRVISAYSSLSQDSEIELLSEEEDDMHRGYRYLFSFFVLTAALAAPQAIRAAAKPQDNGRQEENHRYDKEQNRVYDGAHKDYHNWDDNEDRSYRQYRSERHKEYRPFAEAKQKEQAAYWN
jgi:uncharacterized protein (DUF2225 family)